MKWNVGFFWMLQCWVDRFDFTNFFWISDNVQITVVKGGSCELQPERFRVEPWYVCSLLGPTCDDLDCVVSRLLLPELDVGDWIVFPDMGADMVSTTAEDFGDARKPRRHYVINERSVWVWWWSDLYHHAESNFSPYGVQQWSSFLALVNWWRSEFIARSALKYKGIFGIFFLYTMFHEIGWI